MQNICPNGIGFVILNPLKICHQEKKLANKEVSFTLVNDYHGYKFNKIYRKTYPIKKSLQLTKVQNLQEHKIPIKSVKYL